MKSLPYFRWFPADAETDAAYSALNWAERGFFHWCLNYSWINNGLPLELDELARAARISRRELNKLWERVGQRFTSESGAWRNPRQEEERAHATAKSERNTAAVRTRYERSTNVTTNEPQHARARADSVCVSESSSLVLKKKKEIEIAMPDRFSEWLKPWPRCASPDDAAQAWLSVVNSGEDEEGAFAARDRYLASDEVFRGAVTEPAKWLFAQSRSRWAGVWIPARKEGAAARGPSLADRAVALMERRIANGQDPL